LISPPGRVDLFYSRRHGHRRSFGSHTPKRSQRWPSHVLASIRPRSPSAAGVLDWQRPNLPPQKEQALSVRTTPPFRADHVGSLLRPPELLAAREDHAQGRIDAARLAEIEDAAIRDVVRMQREAGLRSATDGEFRRTSWHMDFIYRLGGISPADEKIKVRLHNEAGDIEFTTAALRVHDRVRLEETIFADHFAFLRDAVDDGVTPKLTIPSPNMVHYRGGLASIDPKV